MNKIIETKRLLLRPWQDGDERELQQGLNEIEVAKNLLVPFPYSLKDAKDFITKCKNQDNFNYYFAVILKENGAIIGGTNISIKLQTGLNGGGIWINKNYHQKGYGTEVWVARAKFAFETLGLNVLTNGFLEDNENSKKMQLKVGGKLTGKNKIVFCPARNKDVTDIETELTKKEFMKFLNKNKKFIDK